MGNHQTLFASRRIANFVLLFLVLLVTFPGLSAQTRRLAVRNAATRDIHVLGNTGAVPVSQMADTVTLRPTQLLIAREQVAPQIAKQANGALRMTLPYQISGIDTAGQPLDYRLVVDVDRGGMIYAPRSQRFEGRLLVGIVDAHDPTATRTLPQPIAVQVTGQADQITPQNLDITTSNVPFHPVELVAASPGNTVAVNFRFSASADPTQTSLDVLRPRLNISASPGQIDGLGLQSATITIRAEGFENPNGSVVTLDAPQGGLDSTSVTLNSSGTGTTSIRSIGIGKTTITAKLPPAIDQQAVVMFQLPWVFLICALGGGFIGALIRLLTGDGAKKAGTSSALLGGVLIGILVAVAYAVGVNLTPIHPAATVGQALVFAVSGVGAYLGKLFMPK